MSWLLVTFFVGGPTLVLWACIRMAGKVAREEERLADAELRLAIAIRNAANIQRAAAQGFFAPKLTIDLDDCKDAADVRSRLAGWSDGFGADQSTHTVE
jgi:hypothetical protein